MKATIADLRNLMKDVLRAVERGESVTLLYRGKPKACIVPIAQELGAKFAEAEVFGMWKDRKDLRSVPGYVRKLRQGRSKTAELQVAASHPRNARRNAGMAG